MGIWDSPEPKKRERRLTSSQIRDIKLAVGGTCETKGCPRSAHDVHHINWDKTDDSYKNLIVLCGACHDDAHGKNLERITTPKQILSGIVRRRAEHKEKRIKEILSKKPVRRNTKKNPYTGFGGSGFKF